MSNMKCPFCGKRLEKDYDWVYGCLNRKCKAFGYFFGSEELWQELIRTRKALDKAKWWLHEIAECTPISIAEMALKDITALEQKDHFADASKKMEQKD